MIEADPNDLDIWLQDKIIVLSPFCRFMATYLLQYNIK